MNKRNIACFALSAALLLSGCGGYNTPSGTEREKDITTTAETATVTEEVTTDTTTAAEKGSTESGKLSEYTEPNLYSDNYAFSDEISHLVKENKKAYSIFYEKDCTDKKVEDFVYTVKMQDFKDFNSFYGFISSIYTADETNRLFNNFMGQGRSFWEENGQFLLDSRVVTFSATAPLYSDRDEIEVLSESENECKIIYWFDTPQHLNINDEVVYKPFGLKISIIKENGKWKLSQMIRPDWTPKNVVFKEEKE